MNLMQLGKTEKIDLFGQIMLANVVTATDRFDCLGQFSQLKGVLVMDGWFQEVHKGKSGDGGSPRGSDEVVEDFLSSLLCAVEKLPVNLNALQICNIVKSVNNLCSHNNM